MLDVGSHADEPPGTEIRVMRSRAARGTRSVPPMRMWGRPSAPSVVRYRFAARYAALREIRSHRAAAGIVRKWPSSGWSTAACVFTEDNEPLKTPAGDEISQNFLGEPVVGRFQRQTIATARCGTCSIRGRRIRVRGNVRKHWFARRDTRKLGHNV